MGRLIRMGLRSFSAAWAWHVLCRTSQRMTRLYAISLLVLAFPWMLVGCAAEGLTASGYARLELQSNATGFELPALTRLDIAEASELGRLTGTCELRRMTDGGWSAVASIQGGGAAGERGLRSFTILGRSESGAGSVEAEVGVEHFHVDPNGTCEIVTDDTFADDGLIAFTGQCDLVNDDGESASSSFELDFGGCLIAD